MLTKAVDAILLATAILGAWFAWGTGRERGDLERTYARVVAITGDLPVGDASKVHVKALETGEPLHFTWRMYFPPSYNLRIRSASGGFFSSGSINPSELLARVRFRENAKGQMQVYTQFSGGSGRSAPFDENLTRFLHGRWGELRVEQLGSPGLAVLDPDKPAVLLRLSLPESLQEEARKVLKENDLKGAIPVLYELKLGPPNASP